MMKKLIGICSVFFLYSTIYAQTIEMTKHEITVGYGVVPVQELATLISDNVIMGLAGRNIKETSGTGVFNTSYRYTLNKRIAIGGTAFYGSTTVKYKDGGSSKWDIYGVMGAAKYNYINKEYFQLYGNASLGYAQYTNKIDGNSGRFGNLAYQISPIGIHIGKKFGFYCEAGFGYGGFVNAGLSVKL